MAGQLAGQPIYILREGSQRTKGKEAQHNNIMAARAVATAVSFIHLRSSSVIPLRTPPGNPPVGASNELNYIPAPFSYMLCYPAEIITPHVEAIRPETILDYIHSPQS